MIASRRLRELLTPAPELRPYLWYSLGLHVALAAAVLGGLPWGGASKSANVYTIDFVGGPTTVTTSQGGAAAQPEAKPEAKKEETVSAKTAQGKEFDEFGRRKKKGPFVLPRPSLLRGLTKKPAKEEPPAEETKGTPSTTAGGNPSSGGGAGSGDAGVSADMPNFPYPWYITQVRQALWNLWSQRMPRSGGEAVVVFSILPDGSVVDLRTEESSGDPAFDIAALGAAQDAAPFPPLPRGFSEPFLKIHVTLKSGG